MYKVTLKIRPNDEWVDGPVLIVDADELTKISEKYEYFKVEDATEEDRLLWGQRIPSGFDGFLT